MPWTIETWSMIFTGAGAFATAVGAGFVWWQVSAANSALSGSNAYMVQKDLIDAYDHVSEAQDQILQLGDDRSQEITAEATLKRQVIRLDTLIETAQNLHSNAGISDETWAFIMKTMCPEFNKRSFRFGDTDLPASKSVCDSRKSDWETNPT
jgi:hypothetical protein